MTRYAADACDPADLPGWALQASYVDAGCKSSANTAIRISSVATIGIRANVGDWEPGNASIEDFIKWVVWQRSQGEDPTLYCADDGVEGSFWDGYRHLDAVAAFNAAGVALPHFWPFNDEIGDAIPDYAVALQIAQDVPPGYDVSVVRDYWPGVDPAQEAPMTPEQAAQLQQLWQELCVTPVSEGGQNAGDAAIHALQAIQALTTQVTALQQAVAALAGGTTLVPSGSITLAPGPVKA